MKRKGPGVLGRDLPRWGTKEGRVRQRRISGTRVATAEARQLAEAETRQTARPRKIEMFGCLNVGVLSQHSSFHPSFPSPLCHPEAVVVVVVVIVPTTLPRCLSSRVSRSRAILSGSTGWSEFISRRTRERRGRGLCADPPARTIRE